jgi:hypothetical protein
VLIKATELRLIGVLGSSPSRPSAKLVLQRVAVALNDARRAYESG